MHNCDECGDVGLTLPECGVYPDFCNCEIGHDLNNRAHDYAYELEKKESERPSGLAQAA